ncbi:MAG: hypothetical protein KAJ03_10815 [Gammaproteobacteria bacterium]|nr:hypothetical protein [Gammaproteobacteria bacterium]MCK5433230.1 hypothetical protein [Gammaproteobacteria bacterium]
MAADPKVGTLYARGLKSGAVYATDVYFSDVDAALLRFDGGAGAGAASPDFYTFPEDVVLYDISMDAGAAGTYVKTGIRLTGDGRPSPSIIRIKNHLNTLNNRPPLGIRIGKGTRVTGIQV